MAQKSNVAVIGLGRFGSSIARSLYNIGHDVLAIDMNESKVHEIMGQVTHSIAGDGTDEGVLRELGIEAYDAAVVAIGSDIVASVMSCVILRTIGISNIVARAHNDTHGNALDRLGVNRIVNVERNQRYFVIGVGSGGSQPCSEGTAFIDTLFHYLARLILPVIHNLAGISRLVELTH